MFAMAELLGDMTSGVQAPFGTGKERSGGRPAPQSRRDQANSSFEIGRAPGEQSEIREGVKKRLAHIRGRLSCGEANEQAAHWRSASESNQLTISTRSALQGAGLSAPATFTGERHPAGGVSSSIAVGSSPSFASLWHGRRSGVSTQRHSSRISGNPRCGKSPRSDPLRSNGRPCTGAKACPSDTSGTNTAAQMANSREDSGNGAETAQSAQRGRRVGILAGTEVSAAFEGSRRGRREAFRS